MQHVPAEKVIRDMREVVITQLALWGWEPVEHGLLHSPVEVRLLNRGEWRCFYHVGTGEWRVTPFSPDNAWQWQPCEWARFATWTLKRLIKLIEGPDWPFNNGS